MSRPRRARWAVGTPSVAVAILAMLSVPVSAGAALTAPALPTTQATPEPSLEPTTPPAVEPIFEPTPGPTTVPTAEPSAEPIPEPTAEPTPESTAEPTADLTPQPSADPITDATPEPTAESTADPSVRPTTEPTAMPPAPAAIDSRGSVASAELPVGSYQTATGLGFTPHGLVRIALEPVHRDLGTQVASAGGAVVTRFSTAGLTAGVYTVTWTPLDERGLPLGAGDWTTPPDALVHTRPPPGPPRARRCRPLAL